MGRIGWETFRANCKRWITFFIGYWKVNKVLVTILESCGSRYQLELQSVTGFLQNSCSAESVYLQPRVLNRNSGSTTIFWWVWRTRNREDFLIESISASVALPPIYQVDDTMQERLAPAELALRKSRVLNRNSGFTTIFWWVWRTQNREEFLIESISASVALPPMY